MSSSDWSLEWPRAFAGIAGTALFKQSPEDFRVYEQLPFAPLGHGEHLLLQIEKTGQNTAWLARQLGKMADIPAVDVSYAGLKDRQGVTTQWFCLRQPGLPPENEIGIWAERLTELEGVRLLQAVRHDRKLRTGALSGNEFEIRLREFDGDREQLDRLLQKVADKGVPNYFGSQRFGRDGHNLILAEKLFSGEIKLARERRGFALSASRSLLFNELLASRIRSGNWCELLDGDVLTFPDAASLIYPNRRDETVAPRFAACDLINTGPLWGKGELATEGLVKELEQAVATQYPNFARVLEQKGLKQERRPLVSQVANLVWRWDNEDLVLAFTLNKGCYATSVLHELVDFRNQVDD
ncbi:tRNA pseudouridine(13) synthase TruD [Parendozoicomonas haliclonae]|uniref:tRNA pseudouridine synthase D n=1 Tax=Parendozoicomonas haliclonae TaxID=1960125 RepID=A0A1X7AHT7_9GAMM|nr:tRNA pseudouridine(13) synthase TruD [Parendozoicomonas haliclonae]SMA42146.1 tRNA pseudouridine synthase D [Parendozoicomonas haliclonae]